MFFFLIDIKAYGELMNLREYKKYSNAISEYIQKELSYRMNKGNLSFNYHKLEKFAKEKKINKIKFVRRLKKKLEREHYKIYERNKYNYFIAYNKELHKKEMARQKKYIRMHREEFNIWPIKVIE